MSHIGEITSLTKGKDLVLIDELGTGTDPKEGEALAVEVATEVADLAEALAEAAAVVAAIAAAAEAAAAAVFRADGSRQGA